jgi:hypothetical protein
VKGEVVPLDVALSPVPSKPRRRLEAVHTRLRVSPWPHGVAILMLTAAASQTLTAFARLSATGPMGAVPPALLALVSLGIGVFAELDARSRYREYHRVRRLLQANGWDERIVAPKRHSRCQRDAMQAAAEAAGCRRQFTAYVRRHGYRWYHIVPDTVLRRPWFCLHPTFWASSFFVREEPRGRCRAGATRFVRRTRQHCPGS